MDIEDLIEKKADLRIAIRKLLEDFRSETGVQPDVVVNWQDYTTVGGTKASVPPQVSVRLTL